MDLDQALELAERAHRGQTDKAGRPYIEHVRRVVGAVETPEQKLTAALHDVLEDTEVTEGELADAGCPAVVVDAVKALTKRPGENYEAFVRRAASNHIARAVKVADVADNADESRLASLSPEEASRLRAKYMGARRILEEG